MNTRYHVYDIRTTMEDFVAAFADKQDADTFAKMKFGEHGYVSDIFLHDKCKKGYAGRRRR